MEEVLIQILKLYLFTFLSSNAITLACLVRAVFDCRKLYYVAPGRKKTVVKFIFNILLKKFKRTLIPVYNLMLTSLEWFNPDIIECTLVDYLVTNGVLISKHVDIISEKNINEKQECESKPFPNKVINRIKKRVKTRNNRK